MRFRISRIVIAALAATGMPAHAELSLENAIAEAIKSDHWARSSAFQEQALRSQAVASGQLPDPKLSLALANLPTDSFDFDQENMTQLQVGLSQQFPRGDSLDIRRKQLGQQADKGPLARNKRAAQLKRQVSNIWLKLHRVQEQLALLETNRHLFQELVDISRANFRSGKTRRFEVIDAELQITRLNDRITRMQQQASMFRSQLNRWLPAVMSHESLPASLPEIKPLLVLDDMSALRAAVQSHPQLRLLAQDIEIRQRGVELADQAYKPGFRLDTRYGLRDDMPDGRDRADFFSIAVTFDLPLFPEKRQDASRKAAVQQREAAKENRLLGLREYHAGLQQAISNYQGLQQRLAIYNNDYLRQLREKRISATRSYAAADGRFSDVAAAAMGELETKLMKIQLEHQQAQTIIDMNYWLAGEDPLLVANDGEVNP